LEVIDAFTRKQTVNVFAILSTFSLASVAVRVIWLAIRRHLSPNGAEPKEYIFFNTQLGHYAICLLIANMLNGAAGLIGLRWLSEKGITGGFSFLVCALPYAHQFCQMQSALCKVYISIFDIA
jgi:hypothetical protein